jgi:hypothetical protein
MVICVAWRNEPGPGFAKLEELAAYTIDRLQADSYVWPPATLQAPRWTNIGNVPYLAARITYTVPVHI